MRKKITLKNRLKTALLAVFFALFSLANIAAPTPVFADPIVVENEITGETHTVETETEAETDSKNADTPKSASNSLEGNNCTNQTGAIGWLVCPTTGVIANATDALLSIINNFLFIEPVSFNNDSPLYIVWGYCRSITNIIFIIILLVCIFSQVTGLGFSSYNIKRVLPKVIACAILINLSFILCSLLVDLSNIIGSSLQGFFGSLEEDILASSGIAVEDFSASAITAGIFTGTGLAAGAGIIAAGGVAAFFWMLLPILLGALVSVITGLLTISMRQAVVLLLVMLAPLAIVAYALPNTEKWFTKWKNILFQMLIFYPTFSFLFGASRLLGFALIGSAGDNIYLILLGIAVEIFPLFFSWQLMKMSGTVLGTINQKLNGLGQSAIRPATNYAASHRALSRAKHNATSNAPSARINRFLEDSKARRESDTAKYLEAAKYRQARNAANVYNRKGQLTNRGEALYALQAENLKNQTDAKQFTSELEDAGYRGDGTDTRIKASHRNRINDITNSIIREVDRSHTTDSFVESAKTSNAVSYAGRTEAIRNQIIAIRNNDALSEAEKQTAIANVSPDLARTLSSISDPETRTQYMNNVFANAISAQAKADRALHDNYSSLYSDTKLTANIVSDFKKSFGDKNYNAMSAAIDELAVRGDFDLIRDILISESGKIVNDANTSEEDQGKNLDMQKHLADTLIKYKNDSAPLWAYAKATNIRRAKNANNPDKVAAFATFEEFETGAIPQGYNDPNGRHESADTTRELSMSFLVGTINNPGVAMTQDRTTFKYLLDAQQRGNLQPNDLGFAIKQLRSAASSGQIDGEQLGNLNKLVTGGIVLDANGNLDRSKLIGSDGDDRKVRFIENHASSIRDNILNYIENMAAGQLAGMKESTFRSFNDALIYLDRTLGIDSTVNDYSVSQNGEYNLSSTFRDAMYKNAASNMNNILKSNMNTNIKNWLGIQNNRQ